MKEKNTISRRRFLETAASSSAGLFAAAFFPSRTLSLIDSKRCYVERSFYTMGSVMTISAFGERREQINQALTKTFLEFQRLDRMMSVFHRSSEVSMINRSAGSKEVPVSTELLEILKAARLYYGLSGGAFDVTIEPLMKLWGFREVHSGRHPMPGDQEIRQASDAVGFHHLEIDDHRRSIGLLNPHSRLDLGGIGVGYAIDRGVSVLTREGIESAFVNHSGDAFALGAPPGEQGWPVVIPDPTNRGDFYRTLVISDRAISTSGNYEKHVSFNNRKYGHVMDPAHGLPAETMLSSTVLASTALAADALSTASFCLGTGDSSRLLRCQAEDEFILIEEEEGSLRETHLKGNEYG